MTQHRRYYFFQTMVAALIWLSAVPVYAAPGALVDSPLFAASNVPPNIFFEIDDSGSMDWSILTAKHWNHCLYDRDADGSSGNSQCFINWRIDNGLYANYNGSWWAYFIYPFANADNAYGTGCGNDIESCSSSTFDADWRIRSKDFNILYFNPDINYQPWDGTGLAHASFSSARSDPQPGSAGYNRTRNLSGFVYAVWQDTHGYSGAIPKRGSNINRTIGSNDEVDLWDEHLRYTVTSSQIAVDQVTYLPTSSGSNEGRLNETLTRIATVSGSLGHAALNGKSVAQVQQDIANWYQYSRRRSFVTKSAVARVITENPNYRYGLSVINKYWNLFIEVPGGLSSFGAHNTNLLNNFFSFDWPTSGTPLRRGLKRTGQYFDNTDGHTDPIVEQCQQNFSVLFTDGYWNGWTPDVGNADGDSYSNTVADVAQYYYDRDLSGLANVVPTNIFDSASHQHMVTFTVAFGLTGLLSDTDSDGWPGNSPGLSEGSNWGNPFNSNPEKIDDLWHAAYNSKGTYVSARTPQAVSNSLNDALANIGSRIGSAASVSFNTTTLTGSSAVFLAQFSNVNNSWTGDLLSFPLTATNGNVATTPNWKAADVLDARSSPATTRTILTFNGTQGIPFQWASLLAAQQDDLKVNPDGSVGNNAIAQARLNYLRGDRANEQGGNYNFRVRSKLLGDIIHSDPIYVGSPQSNWPDSSPFPTSQPYSAFSSGMSRAGMVYVGANDGMLHGFDANTGVEELGYIPNNVFSAASAASGLHYLTDPAYTHQYYVDLPSVVEDAYFDTGAGNAWHSVLVGGNRAGGKGVFALDVTDPSQFSEANAATVALWEFDDSDDSDMGYSYSQASIGMMNNGRWAAIFGNGYNNNGDGSAKLFIVFLEGGLDGVWTPGSDYIELATGAGTIVSSDCANVSSHCNGLSTPQAADTNGDSVIDRIYAGDLHGHLWAFDVSDKSASNWGVGFSGSPLFTTASNQPITNKPAIAKNPSVSIGGTPNIMVVFGSGQYLVADDITTTGVQSFYGVWDHGVSSLTTSDLVEQTFETGSFFNDGSDVSSDFNVLTNNSVDYTSASPDDGWYIRLTQNSGERVIVDSDIVNDIVFFNTWIPESSLCSAGGSGFLMSVKLETGGRPDSAVFDLNGDEKVDEKDLLDDGGTPANDYAATGERFTKGFPASSSFLSDKQYTPGTEEGGTIPKRNIGSSSGMKRISWQELR